MKQIDECLAELRRDGLTVVPNVIDRKMVSTLEGELQEAIAADLDDFPDAFDSGMVHNCMFRGDAMMRLLDCEVMNALLSELLNNSFIIYAYQSSSLEPGKGGKNFGSRIHVDSPRFIPGYATNYGVIFPLNDFNFENGATFCLKGSHLTEDAPSESAFYRKAERAVCNSGDMIVFNARLFHAAGENRTSSARHALTINFCRSYMRSRFDYSRMLSRSEMEALSPNQQKLLGWNVRMPSSLEEFYLPEDERLYKPNQG